jgi:hypothetical protein
MAPLGLASLHGFALRPALRAGGFGSLRAAACWRLLAGD